MWFSVVELTSDQGRTAANVFQGETAITVDDKGRVAIPTAFRDLVARACGNRLVITYNPFEAGSLYLYPEQEWERVRDEVNALPSTRAAHRQLQLKLVGAAAHVELDGNGRISIPASHRSAVGIERKAVLMGMDGKFVLWSEQAHHAQIRQTVSDEDLSEHMLDLQL
ncbi:MAG: division/cell wall cluster transcriptional repressor MraZ [Xanthomonadales bacterium]|nr:division/cell wall cluster transcriptional repressor MraZ [Xanthomonadaceae bacterium]MBN8224705.1 division/cell wall cluster transcriptional repressor MraZ [Xanthomonadales bacterium]MCA0197911.1 division/cell wall cluster transcriptional repressor MraZ [Pseudomonadota bacterium]HRF84256.1 division/cell wall cluster transcriptional repressor MraZ [Pseudoxanthomonas sp.]